jgi:hypothetical protein
MLITPHESREKFFLPKSQKARESEWMSAIDRIFAALKPHIRKVLFSFRSESIISSCTTRRITCVCCYCLSEGGNKAEILGYKKRCVIRGWMEKRADSSATDANTTASYSCKFFRRRAEMGVNISKSPVQTKRKTLTRSKRIRRAKTLNTSTNSTTETIFS